MNIYSSLPVSNITVFFVDTGLGPPFCAASGTKLSSSYKFPVILVKPWHFLFVGVPLGLLRVGALRPVTLAASVCPVNLFDTCGS